MHIEWAGESYRVLPQRPEPLVDFDGVKVPGVVGQVVVGSIGLVGVVDQSLPGIELPRAGADAKVRSVLLRNHQVHHAPSVSKTAADDSPAYGEGMRRASFLDGLASPQMFGGQGVAFCAMILPIALVLSSLPHPAAKRLSGWRVWKFPLPDLLL